MVALSPPGSAIPLTEKHLQVGTDVIVLRTSRAPALLASCFRVSTARWLASTSLRRLSASRCGTGWRRQRGALAQNSSSRAATTSARCCGVDTVAVMPPVERRPPMIPRCPARVSRPDSC